MCLIRTCIGFLFTGSLMCLIRTCMETKIWGKNGRRDLRSLHEIERFRCINFRSSAAPLREAVAQSAGEGVHFGHAGMVSCDPPAQRLSSEDGTPALAQRQRQISRSLFRRRPNSASRHSTTQSPGKAAELWRKRSSAVVICNPVSVKEDRRPAAVRTTMFDLTSLSLSLFLSLSLSLK